MRRIFLTLAVWLAVISVLGPVSPLQAEPPFPPPVTEQAPAQPQAQTPALVPAVDAPQAESAKPAAEPQPAKTVPEQAHTPATAAKPEAAEAAKAEPVAEAPKAAAIKPEDAKAAPQKAAEAKAEGAKPAKGEAAKAAPAKPAKGEAPKAEAKADKAPPDPKQEQELVQTIAALKSLFESMDRTQEQMRRLEHDLERTKRDEERKFIQARLDETAATLARQRENLRNIATGLTPDILQNQHNDTFDWREEVRVILSPLAREVRNLTAQPREIDQLRADIEFKSSVLPRLNQALERIQALRKKTGDKTLNAYLEAQERTWQEARDDVANQLKVTRFQLEQKLEEQRSLTETMGQLMGYFFRSRGRNFIAAVAGFVGVLLALRGLHSLVHRHTPFGELSRHRFAFRLVDVMAYVFIVILAAFSALAILYVNGDWVLLGLSFMLLLGMAWSAKEGLSHFWEQTKLVLNLGAVREGERLVLDGLPWQVERLGYYSVLSNPALTGGRRRLHLKLMVEQASRPSGPGEPWFPCEEGNIVILADGTYGRVMLQTPEVVQLLLYGTTVKTYPTASFLANIPQNLSQGFAIHLIFGVDYRHQAQATTEIPKVLRKAVGQALSHADREQLLRSLLVEFRAAGDSSLDMDIIATFEGSAAPDLNALRRVMYRTLVEACTTHGWDIPFPQMTVHLDRAAEGTHDVQTAAPEGGQPALAPK